MNLYAEEGRVLLKSAGIDRNRLFCEDVSVTLRAIVSKMDDKLFMMRIKQFKENRYVVSKNPYYLISKKFANDVLNVKEINLAIDILYSKLLFKDKIVNGCFVNSTIFDHPDFEEGVKSSTITALGRSIS